MIPYHDIIEAADRRWTARLLSRLDAGDLSDEEQGDLVGALQAVSDLRSFGPLETMVCDGSRPAPVRHAAGTALRGLNHVALDIPADRLRRWWREGDAVLRGHALRCMDGLRCPDIVLRVASDPTHDLQALALLGMDLWFRPARARGRQDRGPVPPGPDGPQARGLRPPLRRCSCNPDPCPLDAVEGVGYPGRRGSPAIKGKSP